MDIADDEFADEFSMFGFNIEDSEIFDKLKQICQMHQLDASEISVQWVAFAQTAKTKAITTELLDQMERDRLTTKTGNKQMKTPVRTQGRKFVTGSTNSDNVEDILGAYGATPTSKRSKRQHTPDNPVNKRLAGIGGQAPPPFSPTSYSPTRTPLGDGTPSKMYTERKNAGSVVVSFGQSNASSWKRQRGPKIETVVEAYDKEYALSSKFKFMFQKLSEKAGVLSDGIEDMAQYLQQYHKKEELSHVALPTQEPVTIVGRIACDSIGKINAKSVLLEGSIPSSGGKTIPVELNAVPQFSIFPGQVVMMDGMNNTGSKFVATRLYDGVPLPLPENKPKLEKGPLTFVVAAGPFTTNDSTQYEPLRDLINHLKQETPDVCILLGPFVDSKQPNVEKAFVKQTFSEVFEDSIADIVNQVHGCHVILVPSQRDLHHDFVYPQPPYVIERGKSQRLHTVSDPCTLVIDDVVFGITSTDILFHLGFEETSFAPGSSDRLSRLSQHVLTQHNYYPLYPPADEMSIDYSKFDEFALMQVTPHVLILPSDLKQFVKDVCGCCVLNPGRLARANTGGTYARMTINPKGSSNASNKSIIDMISTQVRRI